MADFHSPRSTDSSNSFSSAYIYMIVSLLTEVQLRGLPTRNDRLQEDRVLVFDEHQVHVILASDEKGVARVTLGIRMIQDVVQVAMLDVEHHVLESDAAVRL